MRLGDRQGAKARQVKMLMMWVVVVFTAGQPTMTMQQQSEASCDKARMILFAQAESEGRHVQVACYLRATKD